MPDTTHIADTLFHPFEVGALEYSGRGLFLNAQNHSALKNFSELTVQQYFKPYARALEMAGHEVQRDSTVEAKALDFVCILTPKNQIETLGLIAQGLKALRPGGALCVAAANKAGAGRLVKNLQRFGLQNVQTETRNKCRVVWAVKDNIDECALNEADINAQPQAILDGEFQSWPGVYGWNKMDQGSALLLENLPESLKGAGADFGCGYGALSRHVLQNHSLKNFICVDADWRALEVCRANLKGDETAEFKWMDLTQEPLSGLDFIVMNPPFHEGKKADISIGKSFIENAAKSLKSHGKLYMVANKQLPYEGDLQRNFSKVEKSFEGQGFKVFVGTK